jgi:hypothetical protein
MIKKLLILVGRMISLVVGYFVISVISGFLSGSSKVFTFTKEQEIAAGIGLLYVAFFFSGLLLYICNRSNWFGFKLLFAILTLHFGITVFLTHIESILFLNLLVQIIPKEILPYLIIDSSISAVLFSILVITVAGKWKMKNDKTQKPKLNMNVYEWSIKLVILGILYYCIYTLFGRFVMIPIAGTEAFNNYYSGLADHTGLTVTVGMLIFQFFRGVIWVLISIPLISMLKGNKLETTIVVGLSFAVLIGINLLIPNPYMPENIRMAHFVEVMTSNFLFGIIVSYVLMKKIGTQSNQEIPTERQGRTGIKA